MLTHTEYLDFTAHSLVFLRALFYLVYSHNKLKQYSQAIAVVKEWSGKLLPECSRCQCVLLCTKGLTFISKNKIKVGMQIIEKGLELDPLFSNYYIQQDHFSSNLHSKPTQFNTLNA